MARTINENNMASYKSPEFKFVKEYLLHFFSSYSFEEAMEFSFDLVNGGTSELKKRITHFEKVIDTAPEFFQKVMDELEIEILVEKETTDLASISETARFVKAWIAFWQSLMDQSVQLKAKQTPYEESYHQRKRELLNHFYGTLEEDFADYHRFV